MRKVLWGLFLSLTLNSCQAIPAFAVTASWYDSASCLKEAKEYGLKGSYWGKKTASGERFDERALTCASWDYPFDTRLRVTSLSSKRSVIVKVTDRGPAKRLYRKGRIIDLSRQAFSVLNPLSDGVIPIKVERL